jgi:hypothetical protein
MQDKIFTQIDAPDNVEIPKILSCLLSTKFGTIELALGEIGRKLANFVSLIDLTHPEMPCVVNRIFKNDNAFINQVLEVLELADKCSHLSAISCNFKKLVKRKGFSREFFVSPVERFALRLIKDKSKREEFRRLRKQKAFNLKQIHLGQPNSFDNYKRYSDIYSLNSAELGERRAQRYLELGCKLLAEKIRSSLESYKEMANDCNYGFNRITMTDASAILYGHTKIYPIYDLIVSEEMRNVIEHLDSCLAGKPIFDDYMVLASEKDGVLLGEKDNKTFFITHWK